jgi:hypothetical protein
MIFKKVNRCEDKVTLIQVCPELYDYIPHLEDRQ